ncbi:hypothetical protein CVT25_007476 [Psilocybe cyanescens]|uniref:Uncharacterized protein n=1 Tax=Psilocybe cyanescens TaxID=93625 RepID=A0A409XVR5_PSICY|nr:hypothetical protein CVT25_007476 [Psilocybe cyanescens]
MYPLNLVLETLNHKKRQRYSQALHYCTLLEGATFYVLMGECIASYVNVQGYQENNITLSFMQPPSNSNPESAHPGPLKRKKAKSKRTVNKLKHIPGGFFENDFARLKLGPPEQHSPFRSTPLVPTDTEASYPQLSNNRARSSKVVKSLNQPTICTRMHIPDADYFQTTLHPSGPYSTEPMSDMAALYSYILPAQDEQVARYSTNIASINPMSASTGYVQAVQGVDFESVPNGGSNADFGTEVDYRNAKIDNHEDLQFYQAMRGDLQIFSYQQEGSVSTESELSNTPQLSNYQIHFGSDFHSSPVSDYSFANSASWSLTSPTEDTAYYGEGH